MAQTPLFEAPRDRLGPRLHDEVFGALPSLTARALDVPEVAVAVRPLLERGWRPAQLAARVGALPVGGESVPTIVAFLGELLSRDAPQRAWERERAARELERAARAGQARAPASEQSRTHWAAEARRSLGLPLQPRPVAAPATPRSCATCGAAGEFFVTRQVRLCAACVDLLASGRARLAVAAQAG